MALLKEQVKRIVAVDFLSNVRVRTRLECGCARGKQGEKSSEWDIEGARAEDARALAKAAGDSSRFALGFALRVGKAKCARELVFAKGEAESA
jgi:hypothetical protein